MFGDTTPAENYLDSYQTITTKLKKKRFLRQPNYAEAITEYSALISELKRAGAHQFAAFCCLAVARCHQAQKYIPQQAQELHLAGSIFWEHALDESILSLTDFAENTEQAIHCYLMAINIYIHMKKISLASALCHEMGTCLKYLQRHKEAAKEFRRAAELNQSECAISTINSLQEAFSCTIESREYNDSFRDLQCIVKVATEEGYETQSQFFVDKKLEAYISLVLIMLLMGDLVQARLTLKLMEREHSLQSSAPTLPYEIYSTSKWFFLLLVEVINAFEANDEEELSRLHGELYSIFTPIQNRLYLQVMECSRPACCSAKIDS